MIEESEGRSRFKPPRRVPPPSHRALLQVVQRYADFHGIAPNRVQRWITYMVLGGVLSRVAVDGGDPKFLVKGGVSLELRLRLRARATKDFDATFRGERDTALRALEDAFAEPYEGFTFRIGGEPQDMTLHAMTAELESGRPNERFRDLWDLWVLRELLPPSAEFREACEETFRIRAKHPWPPEVVVHDHWVEPFAALAEQEGRSVPYAQEAAEDVREYIRLIAEA